MNLKKFISGVSAFAIAASAFAAMAVTANAATPTLKENTVINGYVANAYYDFTTNTPEVLPTADNDLRYRANYGLHNFGSGNRGATVNIPVEAGQLIVAELYYTSTGTPAINSISGATVAEGISDTYATYTVTTTAQTITINVTRYTGLRAILVMDVDTSVPVDSIVVNYTSGGSTVYSDTTISADGKHVGDALTIPYRRYVTKDGVLYQAARTNNAFTKSVTASADTVVTIPVTAVTPAEGETFVAVADGDGDSGNNASARASYGSAKRGTFEIADVQPGIYKLVYNMYLRKQGDGPELFLDDTSLGLIATGTSWTTDITNADVTVTTSGTLSIKNCDMLDTVVLYKTGDYVAPVEPVVATSVEAAQAFSRADGYTADAVAGVIELDVTGAAIDLSKATYLGNEPTSYEGENVTAFQGTALITVVINGTTDPGALDEVVFN